MASYILEEGVLNDDTLHVAESGKIFKGGYIAIIEAYSFLNSWANSKNVFKFRSEKSLEKHLLKNYPSFEF